MRQFQRPICPFATPENPKGSRIWRTNSFSSQHVHISPRSIPFAIRITTIATATATNTIASGHYSTASRGAQSNAVTGLDSSLDRRTTKISGELTRCCQEPTTQSDCNCDAERSIPKRDVVISFRAMHFTQVPPTGWAKVPKETPPGSAGASLW